jgi:hypothetical protein
MVQNSRIQQEEHTEDFQKLDAIVIRLPLRP